MNLQRRYLAVVVALALLFVVRAVQAGAVGQDTDAIRQVVHAYVLKETKALPGRVELAIQIPDGRVKLARCAGMEAALAPGSQWWGKARVAVHCVAGASWTIYVPVQIKLMGQYVVAARTLGANQALEASDLMFQSGDVTQAGPGVITDVAQAIGKSLLVGLATGQPLRQEALRASLVLSQGQNVRIVYKGAGFSVSAEGRSLTSAREGQLVQVKTTSNQIVSGVARADGVVEVSF